MGRNLSFDFCIWQNSINWFSFEMTGKVSIYLLRNTSERESNRLSGWYEVKYPKWFPTGQEIVNVNNDASSSKCKD